MLRKILLIGLLIFAVFIAYFLTDQRYPIDFEIPQGYVGEVRIKFNIAGAPPLPIKGGHYIARIPTNGLLKTSTVEDEGWGADRFYYVNQVGQRKPIDGNRTNVDLIQNDRGRTNERYMFIGTKQQSKDAGMLIGGVKSKPLKLPNTSESEQSSSNGSDSNLSSSPFQLPPVTQSEGKKP